MHFITFNSGFFAHKLIPKAVLVSLFSLLLYTAQAQQLNDLVVTPIENPFNTIPVFIDYPDDAAIIVTSSLTNLRFDSNVEVIDDKSDAAAGEYRIIIRPFRQNISVQANGYKQLRFTVPVSQAREVLFYSIEPLEEDVDLIPTFFALTPAQALDAAVFIDGQAVDVSRAANLEPGNHQLRIEKQGYRTISEVIEISSDQGIRSYNLEQLQPQTITITSSPSEARVELNDVVKGNTDIQLFEFPGDYFVRISKVGYKSVQQTISVVDSRANTFNFVLEEYGGELNLNVSPANARVSLNNNPVNLVNGVAKVVPGTYTLLVEANGYDSYSEPLVITEDDVISRTISLNQIVGSLQFSVQPISANISLLDTFGNSIQQWQGAQYIQALPIGNYSIRANAINYQPYSETFIIRENQISTLSAQMVSVSAAELAAKERQQQLEDDRRNYEAAEEERRSKAAAKERRTGIFKRSPFGGMSFHYNLFELDGNAFQTNVETDESFGFGMGFYKYKNYKTTSIDFVYNSYTMVSNSSLPDEIISYNLTGAFIPTLPIGPFLIGYGVGLDFTQYEDANATSYFYTYDAFYAFQFTFKPKSWNLGFMIDNRTSWDIGVADIYNPWSQLKYSLILSFQ